MSTSPHTGLHTVLPPHQLSVFMLAGIAIGFGAPHTVAYRYTLNRQQVTAELLVNKCLI